MGTIILSSLISLDGRINTRERTVHRNGTHGHVHGANMGFRGDAYLAAGGWYPLASGEDHDLTLERGVLTHRRGAPASIRRGALPPLRRSPSTSLPARAGLRPRRPDSGHRPTES